MSSEESDDDPEETAGAAKAAWASLMTTARQECTCGLIPCLCVESDWVAAPSEPVVAVEEPPVAAVVLNPGAPTARQRMLDGGLSGKLKPHQVEGVQFVYGRAVARQSGCVLADHMGLGKTLQLIAVLRAYFGESDENKTALVVAPAFVLANWASEVERWLPDDAVVRARCLPASGTRAARAAALDEWRRMGGTLLLGYEMFRHLVSSAVDETSDTYKALCDPGPGLLVLDEAHRLKEPKSLLYRSLSKVRTSSRVLASGYPIQNRLDEYYALVDFARPGALGHYDEFKAFFERPIASYIEAAAGNDDLASDDARLALQRAYVLQAALADVVLRRGNEELGAELPPRRDWLVHCRLSETQQALYDAFDATGTAGSSDALGELASYHTALAIVNHPDIIHLALADEERLLREDDAPPTAKARRTDSDDWHAPELVASARKARDDQRARDDARRDKLRQKLAARFLASAAGPRGDDDDDSRSLLLEQAQLPAELSSWARPALRPIVARDDAAGFVAGQADGRCGSGKAAVALALVASIASRREKCILFTQTLGTLDVLERLLAAKHPKLRTKRIDGSTPAAKRNAIVRQFNDPNAAPAVSAPSSSSSTGSRRKRRAFAPKGVAVRDEDDGRCDVLLMSIKAGGEGINLVGASRVVLFDVSWNPCFDQQALCRAHRFGQTRPVHVYRLVGPAGTMEAKVLRQQRRKELLVKEVADVGTERETVGRRRLAVAYSAESPSPEAVQDDVLKEVLALLGERWVASVHESVPDDARDRQLLDDAVKAAALDDFKVTFGNQLAGP